MKKRYDYFSKYFNLMYINMMSDIKRDSDLGNEESKHTEPEQKESKDEEDNKVEQAMWLSWGG